MRYERQIEKRNRNRADKRDAIKVQFDSLVAAKPHNHPQKWETETKIEITSSFHAHDQQEDRIYNPNYHTYWEASKLSNSYVNSNRLDRLPV